MSTQPNAALPVDLERLRSYCQGSSPLPARLEPWQMELMADPGLLRSALGAGEAPINVVDAGPMERNGAELLDAASACGVRLKIFFARKANKCITFVDRAAQVGYGVDVASLAELAEVHQRGLGGSEIVVTAAVKPEPLNELAMARDALIVLDNRDELERVLSLASGRAAPVRVAMRMAPELEGRMPTRFGLPAAEITDCATTIKASPSLRLEGLHFHLDGYSASDRGVALGEAIELYDLLGAAHPALSSIDIGGGIPMSYLTAREPWDAFWQEHSSAVLGERDPLTFEGHGLGLHTEAGQITGVPAVYPYWQEPIRGDWLAGLLASEVEVSGRRAPLSRQLSDRGIELRCEPGRSLLDGCGLTAALVHFVKHRADGQALVGLGMNRTQCRSTSDDFMVDPILLPAEDGRRTDPISAFLVGAYCIERELITLRKLELPSGVAAGDVVVIPNTAGYLMHILESSSHRMPLAPNLINRSDGFEPDPIDRPDLLSTQTTS